MKKIMYLMMAAALWCGCSNENGNENTNEPGSIYGGVSNKTGEPINAADVLLNPNGAKTTTGNDGSYQFENLDVGEYSLTVSKVGYIDQTVNITVKSGESKKVDIQLIKSVSSIYGTVTANGKAIESAAILLTPGGSMKITGSDGNYNFADLQPGHYELKVFKEGFQSFNKSIDIVAGQDESLAIPLTANAGKLSINKGFIDMGASVNVAGFTILNSGTADITWKITNAAAWINKIDPQNDTIKASAPEAVSLIIDRSKLSSNVSDNYATLLVTGSDGSTAELLITVFGSGNGINTVNDNSNLDYITIGDLFVQTKDLGNYLTWESANTLCNNSVVAGYNDWRLPTIDELATIYTKKEAIGGFKDDYYNYYWSSTFKTGSTTQHTFIDFSSGNSNNWLYGDGSNTCYARAVRRDMAPAVSILPVSNISESSVTFNGRIDNAGGPAYKERGFVYATSHQPTVNNTKVISYAPKDSVNFNEAVTGLSMGVPYYVRAYATSSLTTAYSDELTLVITNQKAQVSTLPVTDIAATSAVFHGNIDSKGIPAYTEKGFVYSATFRNPTVETNDKKIPVIGTGIGAFDANIADLTIGTPYYVCAYAINSEGAAYGQSVSFTPSDPNYTVLSSVNIMVQKADITTGTIDWTSAKNLCENSTIGGFTDWRLPTLNELAAIYTNKDAIGGFSTMQYYSQYWTGDLEGSDYWGNYYYYINFYTGTTYNADPSNSFRARAVRTLP